MKTIDVKLNELEINALLLADGAGQINFPCGSATEIEACLRALLHLEKHGFVSRNSGKAFYRPFTLTQAGHTWKSKLDILASERS